MILNSIDGSTIAGTSLQTADGTWNLGAAATATPGNWFILLNGVSAAGGAASKLVVANGGKMYALGRDLSWYLWNGVSRSWTLTVDPTTIVKPPTSVQINGFVIPVTVSAGATIAASVANGPGNPGDWLAVYAVGAPVGTANPASWKWLSTDGAGGSIPPGPGVVAGTVHLVAPPQAGRYEVRFFPNDGWVVAATSAAITVAAPPPTPVITIAPNAPQVSDTTPKGAVVATYAIAMSDGSPFIGTIAFGAPNFDSGGVFALVATTKTTGSIIVNPNGPGVGPNLNTITDHITLVATS